MKVFICRICGEVYLGESIPPSCPFCGVMNKFLVLGHVWKDENIGVELTEVSKKNLEEALVIELSNTAFYKCIAKSSDNTEIAKTFKSLSKVEKEHAEVFTKLLGINLVETVESCEASDPIEWIKESTEREDRAVKFYAKAVAEATEPRVKEVFQAIMQVEQTHQELDKTMMEKYKASE